MHILCLSGREAVIKVASEFSVHLSLISCASQYIIHIFVPDNFTLYLVSSVVCSNNCFKWFCTACIVCDERELCLQTTLRQHYCRRQSDLPTPADGTMCLDSAITIQDTEGRHLSRKNNEVQPVILYLMPHPMK